MKKMYSIDKKQFEKKEDKIVITKNDLHLRNYLHFQAQLQNVSYLSKNKKKIIPRKQKYKEKY